LITFIVIFKDFIYCFVVIKLHVQYVNFLTLNKHKMKKCILAIGAHPDDLEFGCSVTVRNLIKEGYDAYYVIITNGENGCKKKVKTVRERIDIRKQEQLDAAKKIGVKKVYFFGEKDGFLEYKESIRKKLTLLIKALKPEIVFSFDPANQDFTSINLFHRDHRITGLLAFDSVFAAKNEFIYPHKNGAHKVEKMYLFVTNKPNYFLDITNEINFKLDVLSSYKSQFPNFQNFAKFFKENLSSKHPDYEFSEAFRVMEIVQIRY
jgi:N,N'-diacetylchitobiose non-reducing end deacetylase